MLIVTIIWFACWYFSFCNPIHTNAPLLSFLKFDAWKATFRSFIPFYVCTVQYSFFYWFVQFIYTLLCLWLLIFRLLAIPKLENKYVAQGNSEYWSGWSIHSARSLGALITASSPIRCEVSHGRRLIPWVRKPRGFFIVILSFSRLI